jgi:hypothetical protein
MRNVVSTLLPAVPTYTIDEKAVINRWSTTSPLQ